jgi:type I restriction enzyme S subunit
MEVKPGYKQTEVGVIPEEWEVKRLGELASVTAGGTPSHSNARYWNGDIPWVTTSEVDFQTINHADQFITKEGLNNSAAKLLPAGTLLMALYGQGKTRGKIGVLGIEASTNQACAAISLNRGVSREFVFHFLASQYEAIRNLSNTGNQENLNGSIVRSISVLLPLAPEQRAIAGALSDMDTLIGALDQLVAKKRDLKQAAMQQLLTGRTRLKGFGPTRAFKRTAYGSSPVDWDVMPFRPVSSMNGRIGWQGLKQEEFTESPDDPYLITGMNFKDGKIRWDEIYHIPAKRYQEAPAIQLQVEDVLMTKDGTIGKLLYVDGIPHPGKASLNRHLLVFRPINAQYVPKFLFYQLSSPTFAQHVELHKSGSTFFGLTQEATGKYPVILPPVPEQAAIAEVLSDMDTELGALEQRRDKARALKQGMMQELLTGKIRLI